MGRRLRPHVLVASTFVLAAGFALAPSISVAQDASGTPSMMEEMHQHPAHIHSGTCETLGDVVFPLEDLTSPDMMGTPEAGMDSGSMEDSASTPMAGHDMGEVVAQSTTTVEAPLADILAAEHAINVHLSAEEIAVYIACGDITGTADGDQLEIELEELDGSGYEGMAMLMDNGDDTTTVEVMLMHTEDAEMGQEAATPSS